MKLKYDVGRSLVATAIHLPLLPAVSIDVPPALQLSVLYVAFYMPSKSHTHTLPTGAIECTPVEFYPSITVCPWQRPPSPQNIHEFRLPLLIAFPD